MRIVELVTSQMQDQLKKALAELREGGCRHQADSIGKVRRERGPARDREPLSARIRDAVSKRKTVYVLAKSYTVAD
jgi:hypothetical protein